MTRLTHPVTKHQIETSDDVSEKFWSKAGYVAEAKPAKKAPAKKSASSEKSK